MDRELQLIGRYGLRNKREVWRAQLALATIRKKARTLLILEENVRIIYVCIVDTKYIFIY